MDNPFIEQAEIQFLLGLPGEALQTARMGLTLFRDDTRLLELAAGYANALGEDQYALGCWQRLFELDPSSPSVCNSLALTLARLQHSDEAELVYREGLAAFPDAAALRANLGLLLENTGRLDEAEHYQREALALAPDSAEICSNLACLLVKLGGEAEAENLYRQAINLQPDFASAYANLGVLLTDCGRQVEAEDCFRQALEIQPDSQVARMNLGQLLLLQGRFAEGWVFHEERLYVYAEDGSGPHLAPPPCPQWQGEALAGKAIMVLPEQGLGDEIQFVRYVAWLKAQGPAQLTLICRPSQKALLATLAGPDRLLSLDEAGPYLAGQDYWTLLLSLPLHAGTRLETIPAAIPYLFPDPVRQARHASLLAGGGLRVGLVWRGNPWHSNDGERSLSGLEVLAPLWSVRGVRFFSLQKSENSLPPSPGEQPLVDLAPAIDDMADSAAMLSQLDLLICVDTAMAHLAGALGVPCWLLLPSYKADWRWLQGRGDSPWYPGMRLFRQPRRGDWPPVIAEVAGALQLLRDAA